MTTPKPPKGRRWLRKNEVLRKGDRYHDDPLKPWSFWHNTRQIGERIQCDDQYTYSRAIPRKTTRK